MTAAMALPDECVRLLQRMQTVTFALEQGTVAVALPVLLAPLVDAANNVCALADQVPAATTVKANRDVGHQADLDANGLHTDLIVPPDWTE